MACNNLQIVQSAKVRFLCNITSSWFTVPLPRFCHIANVTANFLHAIYTANLLNCLCKKFAHMDFVISVKVVLDVLEDQEKSDFALYICTCFLLQSLLWSLKRVLESHSKGFIICEKLYVSYL